MDFGSPPFPMPSAGAMNPPSNAEGVPFYLVLPPQQGTTHLPNIPSPGRTPSPLPPPYLPPSQPHTAISFPIPQGKATPQPSPSYYSREPEIPHLPSHSGVSGATQIHAAGRNNQDDSDDDDDEAFHTMHDGGRDDLIAKSPPNLPFFSSGRAKTRLFRKQTLEQPAHQPQPPTYPCRFPGCLASVRSDVAARLGGFCSDTHMWLAIHNGIVQQCPRCQRICPEGSKYCSALCATGRR